MRSLPRHDEPAVVTSAPLTLSEERSIRQRRYALTMGLRTVGFIVAITVPMPFVLRMVILIATMIVPWIAVMAANQPHRRVHGRPVGLVDPTPVAPLPRPALGQVRVVEGDVVD